MQSLRAAPIVLAVFVIVAGLLLVSVDQAAKAQQQAEEDIRKIGILLNYNSKTITDLAAKTYELAVDDFNKRLAAENRGWQLDYDIEVARDVAGARAALEKFDNDGITAVAGIIPDATLVEVDDLIHENDMVAVVYLSGLKENAKPDNVYRIGTNYEHLAESFVQIMQSDDNGEMVIIFIDSPVSRGMNASMYELASNMDGISVLGSIKFPPGLITDAESDRIMDKTRSLLASAQDNDDVGIAFLGTGNSLPVLRAVSDLDEGAGSPIRKATFYSYDSLRPAIASDATTFDFLLNTEGFYGISSGEHENEDNIRIDSILGRSITVVTYDSYTSLYILGLALDLAGTATDTDAIKDQMHRAAEIYSPTSARGLSTYLDENGDVVERDLHISSIQHGQFEFTRKYDPDAIHRITDVIDFQEPERLTVGAIVSETGSLSEWLGKQASDAISLAVADYNKEQFRKATIDNPGWRIDLLKRDDGTDPASAREHADRLANTRGLHVIIGPASSGALAQMQSRNTDVPIFSYASSSPLFSIPNDNIFRIVPDDTGVVQQYLSLLKEDGIKHAVIIYRDDPWGQKVYEELKKGADRNLDISILDRIAYAPSETDHNSTIDRLAGILAGAPDGDDTAVLLFGFGEVVEILTAASQNQQIGQERWYGYGIQPSLFEDPSRAGWLEDVGYTIVTIEHVPNAVSARIDAKVETSNIYAYRAYDAVTFVADALSDIPAHAHTPFTVAQMAEKVREGRQGPNALGVPLIFNANGDLDADYSHYSIKRVSGGEFVTERIIDSVATASAKICR